MTFCCALSCNMYFTLQNITWAKETLYISLIPQKVCQRFHLDCTLYSDSRQWRSALVKISAASFCCHWQCVESIGQEVWSCLSQQVTTNHGDNVSSQLCQKNVGPSLRSEDFRRWVRSERWKWCSISDFAASYQISQWQGWWWWQKEDDVGVDDGDGGDDDVGGDEAGRAAPELLLQFVPTLYRPSHHQ